MSNRHQTADSRQQTSEQGARSREENAGSTENRADSRSRKHGATSSMSEVNKLMLMDDECARLLKVNIIHVTFKSRAGLISLVHFFGPSTSRQKEFCD